jgi:hypothetical protein
MTWASGEDTRQEPPGEGCSDATLWSNVMPRPFSGAGSHARGGDAMTTRIGNAPALGIGCQAHISRGNSEQFGSDLG